MPGGGSSIVGIKSEVRFVCFFNIFRVASELA